MVSKQSTIFHQNIGVSLNLTHRSISMNDYYVSTIDKSIAKQLIVDNHYTHAWTMCSFAIGIYIKNENEFFDNCDKLIGCIVYGSPVARHGVKSISENLEFDAVWELKRLWIEDGHGTNIESYSIAQSIKYIKQNYPKIKVLISYSDPMEKHIGLVYRATNWLYQGNEVSHSGAMYQYRFSDNEQWLSPRAMNNKIGVCGLKDVLKVYPNIQYKPIERKHRYLFFLCPKKEKKKLIEIYKNCILPDKWKNFLCGYLENNMNTYTEEVCIQSVKEHINYLNRLDEIRGTNWKKTFPEIVELLKDYV